MSDGLNTKTTAMLALVTPLLENVAGIASLLLSMATELGYLTNINAGIDTIGENQGAEALILESIEDRIGAVTGDATTTVLGRLAAIEGLLTCICGDIAPPTTGPGACASPSSTVGGDVLTFEDVPGRAFPVWGATPPAGLDLSGSGELYDAGISVICNDVGGTYSYFVQSRAPTHRRRATSNVNRPNNTWLSLASDEELEINVSDDSTAIVLLCYEPAASWTECTDIDSVSATYYYNAPDYSQSCQVVPFGTLAGQITDMQLSTTGAIESFSAEDTVLHGELNGIVITRVSANAAITITWETNSDSRGQVNLNSDTESHTMPADCVGLYVACFVAGHLDETFVINICPAA